MNDAVVCKISARQQSGGRSMRPWLRLLDRLASRRADHGRDQRTARVAALATSLTAWLRHLALDGDLAKAATKTLRFRLLSAPARLVTHARRKTLKVPPGWAWAPDFATAWDRLQALHPA